MITVLYCEVKLEAVEGKVNLADIRPEEQLQYHLNQKDHFSIQKFFCASNTKIRKHLSNFDKVVKISMTQKFISIQKGLKNEGRE